MEDYCEYLIQEITSAMNTLREKYPDTVMKMFVDNESIFRDENGNFFIDALDHSFVFEY